MTITAKEIGTAIICLALYYNGLETLAIGGAVLGLLYVVAHARHS